MDARQIKAQQLATAGRITRGLACWYVPSQSGNGRYKVTLAGSSPTCTCSDHELTGKECKHILAVKLLLEWEREGQEFDRPTEPPPNPPRKTYPQVWPAYHAAQVAEKARFQDLLAELCRGIEEPPRQGRGRRPLSLADMVFSLTFKVYSTFSGRRFMTDLADAHERGYLSQLPHYNSLFHYFENPALTPLLRSLVHASSLPLKAVELDFAADSSAFTTSKFVRWFDQKWGKVREWHQWVKVQAMCGVKTNVVTSVEVCEQDGPDSPYLPQLVKETAQSFTVREVSADKGYSSVDNHEAVAAAGATPFIAFKVVATGYSGGLWERMFHYFQFRREDFLQHYHKRSNAESTFSMIKRKFGDALRSKTKAALENEMLCKFLAHNLCCVNQEMHELGIEPVFWPGEKPAPDGAESPTVLPFIRPG